MKKKIIVTLILIFLILLSSIIFFNIFNYSNKKETIVSPIANKAYYVNVDGNEYIKFLSDSDYELKEKTEDNLYKIIKGKYTFDDENNLILDNMKYIIFDDKIVSEDNAKRIYFSDQILASELIKLKEVVSEYVDDIKKNNANLAYPKNVKISLDECYYNDSDTMTCGIQYNIYFDNYIKSVCDELENDKMFFPYTYSNGYCENNYISNFIYFELKNKKDNYKILKTYNNL